MHFAQPGPSIGNPRTLEAKERDDLRVVIRDALVALEISKYSDLAGEITNLRSPTDEELIALGLRRSQWEAARVKWPVQRPDRSELRTRGLAEYRWQSAASWVIERCKVEHQ